VNQPKPVSIQVHCRGSGNEGRVAVTCEDGRFIGSVTYDIQNPQELHILVAQAFMNAVASTAPRVQPVQGAVANALRFNGKQ
jgi:hypothetical protein